MGTLFSCQFENNKCFPASTRNPDTVGIGKSEIRRVGPVSPLLAHALESWFPFLRTHAVYLLGRREIPIHYNVEDYEEDLNTLGELGRL